jgi:rare lipoprotein A
VVRGLGMDVRAIGLVVILAAAGFTTRPAPQAASPDGGSAAAEGVSMEPSQAPARAGADTRLDDAARAQRGAAPPPRAAAREPDVIEAPDYAVAHLPLPSLPASGDALDVLTGTASYYASSLAGRRTASGERYDPRALVAAHRHLPFGTVLRVTNPANERSVEVRVIDRGPFTRGRVIDLSRRAAEELGMIRRGHAAVRIEVLSYGS